MSTRLKIISFESISTCSLLPSGQQGISNMHRAHTHWKDVIYHSFVPSLLHSFLPSYHPSLLISLSSFPPHSVPSHLPSFLPPFPILFIEGMKLYYGSRIEWPVFSTMAYNKEERPIYHATVICLGHSGCKIGYWVAWVL